MKLTIRALYQHPELLGQVAAWHHRECLRQGLQTTLAKRKERLQKHLCADHPIPQTWLALDAGRLIGCISLVSYHLKSSETPSPGAEPLWLSNLYVEPAFRRRGVGSDLIRFTEAYARRVGECELWLMASEYTDFYRTRGWQLVRRARVARRSVNVMRRVL